MAALEGGEAEEKSDNADLSSGPIDIYQPTRINSTSSRSHQYLTRQGTSGTPLEPPILVPINHTAAPSSNYVTSNEIRTSRYTPLTFLPRNLFEQFRLLHNVYFLINAVVSIATPFSPVGAWAAVSPLLFVLGVAAVKDAYEDYVRMYNKVAY